MRLAAAAGGRQLDSVASDNVPRQAEAICLAMTFRISPKPVLHPDQPLRWNHDSLTLPLTGNDPTF